MEVPGVNGINAYTTTGSTITLPAVGANVAVATTVGDSTWMPIGQYLFGGDGSNGATFQVVSKASATSVQLKFLGNPNDAAPGTVLSIGTILAPSGQVFLGTLPTAITDNSGGTPSSTIAAGAGLQKLFFRHTFIGGTAAVEPVTNYTVGYAFKIISWAFVTDVLLVGASGSRIANMEINSTDVGTVPSTITIPIANAAVGVVTTGTPVSGAATGTSADTFSIEIASGGTAFTAGSGTFIITIQNLDSSNAIASLAADINTLIAAF